MTFSTFLRPAALAAIALTLAACGGKASFPINGTVSGLSYDGLVLTTNGMDLSVPKSATSFSFPNTISYGETYAVTVKAPPAHQSCTTVSQSTGLETATGTAGLYASINLSLTCYLNTYSIGGNVTGLTSEGLTLTNGSAGGTVTLVAATTTYVFGNLVAYGSSYGVSILTQPANDICTVSNPTGVMGDALINNINVTCVPKPAAT
jgi:hypothetical protein